DIDRAHLRARHAGNFEHRHTGAASLHFDLDFLVVQFAFAQLLAEALARRRARPGTDQGTQHALFSRLLGARAHILALSLANELHADFNEVTDNLFDIAADVSDFRKLGGLDLEKRRAGELGESAGNLGLPDTRRPDHQDIFGEDFFAQSVVELQTPPAVAQC